jgi:acyl carrier protein
VKETDGQANPEFIAMLRPFLKFAGGQEIGPGDKLRDLGLDSMREIELLFAIEDTYGVTLPDEMLTDSTFSTVGHLWATIEQLGVQQGAPVS